MSGDSQKEVFNRIHYLLTGVLAENIPAKDQFTACTGDLVGTWAVLGWETIDNQAYNIPVGKDSVIVLDLPDDVGYVKNQETEGYPVGTFTRVYTIGFDVIRRLTGFRSVIMGSGATKGIIDVTNDLLTTLTGSKDAMALVYNGSKWVDDIIYPIEITEQEGIDPTGRVFARARKFTITYRVLDIEY